MRPECTEKRMARFIQGDRPEAGAELAMTGWKLARLFLGVALQSGRPAVRARIVGCRNGALRAPHQRASVAEQIAILRSAPLDFVARARERARGRVVVSRLELDAGARFAPG